MKVTIKGRGAPIVRVLREMTRQDEKWGQQDHPDGTGNLRDIQAATNQKEVVDMLALSNALTWRAVLLEEVYEALAETDPARLKEELDQVAAVAIQWGLSIDRREET